MNNKKMVLIIIQARMSSSRLPGKVLASIGGHLSLDLLIKRLKKSKSMDQFLVAMPKSSEQKDLKSFCAKNNITFFEGDEDNVLKRFYDCAKLYNATHVVRITGDCPFIDSEIIDHCIQKCVCENYDYVSNTLTQTFPDGLNVAVFTMTALEDAYRNAKTKFDKEHVTPFIKRSLKYNKYTISLHRDKSHVRITIDEKADLIVANNVVKYFHPNIYFNTEQILEMHDKCPHLFNANAHLKRNEGSILTNEEKHEKYLNNID
jgi:glutamate-1-semialdehyde 2,1-aminomutase